MSLDNWLIQVFASQLQHDRHELLCRDLLSQAMLVRA